LRLWKADYELLRKPWLFFFGTEENGEEVEVEGKMGMVCDGLDSAKCNPNITENRR